MPLKGQGEPMGIPELKVGVTDLRDTIKLMGYAGVTESSRR